jgi:hypothetical protein
MKRRAYHFSLSVAPLILSLILFKNCGIYTTTAPLDPPFSQSVDSTFLMFSGNNDEAYFVGYNIYYKESPNDFYKVCDNTTTNQFPTVPAAPSSDTVEYSIDTNNLRPQGESRSFYDLYYNFDGDAFFFAVSSVGDEDQESERIEFGAWPTPAAP